MLGAHFLRAGNVAMVAVVVLLLALLGVRSRWTVRLIQAALLLGAAEWLRTLARLVALRVGTGQPVLRLMLILGGVALLTALSALVFRTARVKHWYERAELS